ncbi:MAG: hopanoid biosynthesis-associated protein HpnK [Novosphingobium sp.]
MFRPPCRLARPEDRAIGPKALKRLIITADDFGLSVEVNEAVELAHRQGILTCASLMVTGPAAQDALRRARRLPNLGVGLHLALYDAPAACPEPSRIAPDGQTLGMDSTGTGIALMLSGKARAAARREIAAQFDAFRQTGLQLGHLDGHWHCHQHPAILALAIEAGQPLGLRAVRVPYEPHGFSRRVAGGGGMQLGRLAHVLGHFPLALEMRRQLRRARLRYNDSFFGKNDAGAVDEAMLARMIAALPGGVTEAGLHPAAGHWAGPHNLPADWQPATELAALTSPALRQALAANQVELCRWADLP